MRWTVGAKIGAGFLLGVIIFLIVGAIVHRNTNALVAAAQVRKQSYQTLQSIESVVSAIKDAETGQRGYLITGQDSYLDPYKEAQQKLGDEVAKARKLTEKNPAHQERLALVEKDIAAKMAELEETIVLRRDKGFEAASQIVISNHGKALMDHIRQVIDEMKTEENRLLEKRNQETEASARNTFATIEYGLLISVALVSLVGYAITQNISKPLREITEAAERIAGGDLNIEMAAVARTDEIGVLRNTFHRMTRSLKLMAGRAKQMSAGDLTAQIKPQSDKDVLGHAFAGMTQNLRAFLQEVLEAVNVLASSASEIMASTAQLASGAAETAAAVTQTTATVEEVKHTSKLSSEKGKLVSESAQKAAQVSLSGKRSVEETIQGIGRIRAQMDSIAESIVRLSEQSMAIGEIISVVDDLAAQSNLLAVNASIEAAKAGEQGRGFAVVAQEVKSLSQQSRHATTQVRALLTEIQKATSAAVMAAEQGSKAVEAGVTQSKTGGEAIRILSESIADAAQAAMQIGATGQQQFVGMDQVALAMENIKLASVQTLASTRQAETAAQGLHDLGQKLKRLVETFKV